MIKPITACYNNKKIKVKKKPKDLPNYPLPVNFCNGWQFAVTQRNIPLVSCGATLPYIVGVKMVTNWAGCWPKTWQI